MFGKNSHNTTDYVLNMKNKPNFHMVYHTQVVDKTNRMEEITWIRTTIIEKDLTTMVNITTIEVIDLVAEEENLNGIYVSIKII